MTISDALRNKIQTEFAELTSSINSIIETFRAMKNPLVESRKQVPQATIQLDKIANQTEEAAHVMLDRIEQITQRETRVIDALKALPKNAKAKLDVSKAPLNSIIDMAQENLDDVYLVMDALQFQDITSQQIQHAAHVLEEIEAKLQGMVTIVTGEVEVDENKSLRKRVFDPHAEFQDRRADQADIDNMFEKATGK